MRHEGCQTPLNSQTVSIAHFTVLKKLSTKFQTALMTFLPPACILHRVAGSHSFIARVTPGNNENVLGAHLYALRTVPGA
jgi:hypothetical protein